MEISGQSLLGAQRKVGAGATFRGFDPVAQKSLAPDFRSATITDVSAACALADEAFDFYASTSLGVRADFLESIARSLARSREPLIERAGRETGLPKARLEGELARTMGQLSLFARVLRDGDFLDVRIDPALPERAPPRPDIRLQHAPLGAVAVFGASNFPLAFSVAGGDTASALAAGCPVIVKAHPAHPGASELAGLAIQRAIAECSFPAGVFSLLFDGGHEVGLALVRDPRVQAVGFTGSRRAGLALVAATQARPQPIPVYAEMSSINPVLLLPGALRMRADAIGTAFFAALTLGAGQFCTNPGIILALESDDLSTFVQSVSAAAAASAGATMLTPAIHAAFKEGVAAQEERAETLVAGPFKDGLTSQAFMFSTSAERVLNEPVLREEVFGPSSVLVRCRSEKEMVGVLDALEGQLTIAVHATEDDWPMAARLLPRLQRRAGRVLFNGFGTGVEVCDAMVHGGPFPATSDARTTSVGSLAIKRFLRPVCYQDVPATLLPMALRDDNPMRVPQLINGRQG